jgi:hypothetical protein
MNKSCFIRLINKLGATLKDNTTTENEQKNDRQNANPSQNKKSCKPTHKPTQFAAHFILPNRTQAHPPPHFRTGDNLKGIFDRKAA